MLSKNISLSGNEVLCEFVPMEDFKGFLQQRLGVAPDTLTVLIRDGKVADASHGAHIAVGGIWRSIKESVGGSHALQLLIADAKPFEGSFLFNAMSKDNVEIQGEVTLQLQVDPQSGSNILGLCRNAGTDEEDKITNKSSVFSRLIPHVNDRVLQAIIGQVNATEIRGAVDIQNKVQAEMLNVVEHVLGDMGIVVRANSINWAANDEEIAELESRARVREQLILDEQLAHYKKEIDRAKTTTVLKLESELDIEKVRACSEDELRTLIASQETEFVAVQESSKRKQRIEALEGEIVEFNLEQQAKFTNALGEAKNAVEVMKIQVEMTKLEGEIDELKRRKNVTLKLLEEHANLEIIDKTREGQEASILRLNEAERLRLEGLARIDREKEKQASDAKIAEMTMHKDMSPEQILAIQAGLSESVAAIFVEKAKTDNINAAEQKELLKKYIDNGPKADSDARFFFDQAMKGVVGVAAGAGPGGAEKPETKETINCPRCHAVNSAAREFCVQCTNALRV